MPFKYIAVKDKKGDCKVLKVQTKAKPKKLTKKDLSLISSVDNRNEQRRLLNVYNRRLEQAKKEKNDRVEDYIKKFIDALKAHNVLKSGPVDTSIKKVEELQKIKEKEEDVESELNKRLKAEKLIKGLKPLHISEEQIKKDILDLQAKKEKAKDKIAKDALAETIKQLQEGLKMAKSNMPIISSSIQTGIKPEEQEAQTGEPLKEKPDMPLTEAVIRADEIIQTPIGPRRRGAGSDALYNDQIDTILKGDDKYLGCVALDKIPIIPEDKPSGFVINMDTSDMPGSHWCSTYIDPTREKTIEYFDPFGKEPPESWMSHMKQLAKTFPHMMKLKINTQPNQNINSDNCGWISSWFLIQRFNGVPYIRATNYKEKDSADNNEKDIKNIKNNVFPYI